MQHIYMSAFKSNMMLFLTSILAIFPPKSPSYSEQFMNMFFLFKSHLGKSNKFFILLACVNQVDYMLK